MRLKVESGPEGLTRMLPQPLKIRFTKAKDGFISDNATGMEWYVGPDRDTTWKQAKSWTEILSAAGGGWRMPTIPELKAIYQPGAVRNNMDPLFQTTGNWVWSGQLRGASLAWHFDFADGKDQWDELDFHIRWRAFAVRSRR